MAVAVWSLLAALIAFIAAVACDLLVARITGRRTRGYAASLAATIVLTPILTLALVPVADIFLVLIVLGIALMGWFVYLNLAQAVESSIRFRVIQSIHEQGDSASLARLTETYDDRRLLRLRLERLVEGGAVERTADGTYRVRSGGLKLLAGFFSASRRFLLGQGETS